MLTIILIQIYCGNSNLNVNHTISVVAILLALTVFLFVVLTNIFAYGQQILPSEQRMLTRSLSTPLKPYTVKITSPIKGQQVLIGKNLTISGITDTAAGNIATSHCQVSIIANGIKPYQPAIGSGPSGAADYSKWNFVLSSKYATIKQGPNNKITAKYTCSNNPAISSFYSVNVTGVISVTDQHNQAIRKINATATNNRGTGVVNISKVEYPSTNSTVITSATSPRSDNSNSNDQETNNISTGHNHVSQIGGNVSTLPNQSATNYHNSGRYHHHGNNISNGNHSVNHSLNSTINELKNRVMDYVKKQLEGSGIRVPLPIS